MEQIKLELENVRQKNRHILEEEKNKHRLTLDELKSKFNREQEIWSIDKEKLKYKEIVIDLLRRHV